MLRKANPATIKNVLYFEIESAKLMLPMPNAIINKGRVQHNDPINPALIPVLMDDFILLLFLLFLESNCDVLCNKLRKPLQFLSLYI
jgi:hypothetical protein